MVQMAHFFEMLSGLDVDVCRGIARPEDSRAFLPGEQVTGGLGILRVFVACVLACSNRRLSCCNLVDVLA